MAARIGGDNFAGLGDLENFTNIGHYRNLGMFVDNRGKLSIHPSAVFGFEVMLLTACHYPDARSPVTYRTTTVCKDAFIGSRAILYNCIVGEKAMVSAGTVVRSRIVRPYTLVEGNPAMEVAEWVISKWLYYTEPRKLKHIKTKEVVE